MTHDSDIPRTTPHERHAQRIFAVEGALALAAAGAAAGFVSSPILAGWVLAVIASAALSRHVGLPAWLAGGLLWGGGAGTLLHLAASTPAAGSAMLAVALAVVLAALRTGSRLDRLLSFSLVAVLPPLTIAGLDASMPFAALPAFALAIVVAWLAYARHAALLEAVNDALAHEHNRTLELEHLEEEVQRLRIETRTAGEVRENLAGKLTSVTSELAVLRGKTGALSTMLERINPYDTETGLLTAAKFRIVMEREWARMRRQEQPLSLLLVSVDRYDEFRRVQSRLAYEAGLRRISDVLRGAGNRPGDVAARLGPGTFGLLYPETDHRHVARLAETVRARIRQLRITTGAGKRDPVLTATVGMATVIPNSDITPEALRDRVEAALYEGQFQGGDRSVRYRTLDGIRVERWDLEQEGLLTADGIRHKLAVLGYDAMAKTYRPGDQPASRRLPVDSVAAVVEGQLKIVLEGEERVLRPGDLIFIPKGLVMSLEASGGCPVLCMEAIRA